MTLLFLKTRKVKEIWVEVKVKVKVKSKVKVKGG